MRSALLRSSRRGIASKAAAVKSEEAGYKAIAEALQKAYTPGSTFSSMKAVIAADPALAATASKAKTLKAEGVDISFSLARAMSSPTEAPVTVAVTGAGSDAAAEALYKIAAGEMLGPETPVVLQVEGAAADVVADLKACAFPLLKSVTAASSADAAIAGAAYAYIGAGGAAAGKAVASVKGIVVACASNADAAAVAKVAPSAVVTAVTEAPAFAAAEAIADKLGCDLDEVSNVIVWGNSSVDLSHTTVKGNWAKDVLSGPPPAPSATNSAQAIVTTLSTLAMGSKDWVSMGVPAVGDYGMGTGFFYSVPVWGKGGGEFKRVGGISIDPATAEVMEKARVELSA
jgi:malate dehydrogenase